MVVSSTCFRHKEIHKQTWISPDGKTNNQIGHTLVDKRNASSMLDVKLCRGASSDSDNFLVRGRYRYKIAYSKYEPNRTTRRLHVASLREASMVRRFQQQVEEEFGKLETERVTEEKTHIEEEWKKIKQVIMEAAEQTLGYQPNPDRS